MASDRQGNNRFSSFVGHANTNPHTYVALMGRLSFLQLATVEERTEIAAVDTVIRMYTKMATADDTSDGNAERAPLYQWQQSNAGRPDMAKQT